MRTRRNNRKLYETIMTRVAREVKRALNEASNIPNGTLSDDGKMVYQDGIWYLTPEERDRIYGAEQFDNIIKIKDRDLERLFSGVPVYVYNVKFNPMSDEDGEEYVENININSKDLRNGLSILVYDETVVDCLNSGPMSPSAPGHIDDDSTYPMSLKQLNQQGIDFNLPSSFYKYCTVEYGYYDGEDQFDKKVVFLQQGNLQKIKRALQLNF